jgi:hypothetical protein
MKIKWPILGLALFYATTVSAQQPPVTIKVTGATFLEAPPSRDKNLVPFGSFNEMEKVEVHAVLSFKDRIIADAPFFPSGDSSVKATATLLDKTSADLGSAKSSSFRKTSEDRKYSLISFSVSRLPDKPASSVMFAGTVKVSVAKRMRQKVANFEPKVGAKIELGLGETTITAVEANSFTLSGGDQLGQVAELKFIKLDGTKVKGERGSYGRRGGERVLVTMDWSFGSPISAGKLEATLFEGLETIEVPVKLSVAKPY